jgi:hypothetical protein
MTITVAFLVWLGWKAGLPLLSALLRMAAWVLIIAVVLSVFLGLEPATASVAVCIAGFWLTGQAVFRVRRGYWRSPTLQRAADGLRGRKAENPGA